MIGAFLSAAVLGFSIAAPVGPVGALCITRTLSHGPRIGLATGLGAACADAAYAFIAGCGLLTLAAFDDGATPYLRLVGVAYLLVLAGKVATSAAAAPHDAGPSMGLGRAWLTTFFLTLTNPMTIASFIALFAALPASVAPEEPLRGPPRAVVLAAGVFVGSAAWWILLSAATGRIRRRLDRRHLICVNYASALILAGFAVASIVS